MDKALLQRLYRYCFSLTADPNDAEDLLHTAVEKWIKADRQQEQNTAYMRRIIRNTFIDQCRRQKIVSFEALDEDSPMLLNEISLEELQIQRNLIQHVFAQLNSAEREVLYLWSMEGFSATEIADETGQPRGTVLSRLYRIRKKVDAMNDISTSNNAPGSSEAQS